MANAKDQVLEIAKDLLNLEINTILSGGITGGKMPAPQNALRDVARWYLYTLFPRPRDSRDQLQRLIEESVEGGRFKTGEKGQLLLTRVYDMYHRRCQERITAYFDRGEPLIGESDEDVNLNLMLLFRISDASKQIIGILEALQSRQTTAASMNGGWFKAMITRLRRQAAETQKGDPLAEFTSNELLQIRKIWEIGTDVIVMQTVVQLDGDVVTRIRPDHLTEQDKYLQQLHEYSVKLSVDFWKQLIEILSDFFEKIITKFVT